MANVREITDAGEWNGLVAGLGRHELRQAYEWGEVRRRQGWSPRRLAAFEGDSCVAAVSLLARTVPALGAVLYAPGGPLVRSGADKAALASLLESTRRVARETGAVFLRVNPTVDESDAATREALLAGRFRHLPEDWTTWNDPRIVMTLDLNGTERDLKQRMSKRVAQYIGRAVKLGATLDADPSPQALAEFHALLRQMGRRKKIPTRDLAAFETLREVYIATGQGALIMARHAGRLLGAVMVVRFGERATLLYAAQDVESAEARAFHTGPSLYWQMMLWARSLGCTALDLGGSATYYPPRGDEPGFGVYHFKQGCGAQLRYLTGYYDLVFRPALYQGLRVVERRLLPIAWDLKSRFDG